MAQAALGGLRAFARKWFQLITIAAPAALVLGCGGGGGSDAVPATPDTPMIHGTAAQGAALDGTVSIKDSNGRVVSTSLAGSSGEFSISAVGLQAPFMLRATSQDGQTVVYSAAVAPGRANVTPLTHISLMRLAAQQSLSGPAELYARPDRLAGVVSGAALHEAASVSLGRLMPSFVAALPGAQGSGSSPSYDPFTTRFTVGDAVDRLLDLYPIRLAVDTAGVETATQAHLASGAMITVLRSDTAAALASTLTILGTSTDVVAGTSAQLSTQARFTNEAVHAVTGAWSVSGGGEIDANGRFVAPAVSVATQVTVRTQWFDGTRTLSAEATLRVVPAMRPVLLDILGAEAGRVAANGELALTSWVLWSDGSATSPVIDWRWMGDASAVRQISAQGRLYAGAPTQDQAVELVGRFTHQGVVVEARRSIVVSLAVPTVVSLEINGFTGGMTLLAGAGLDLVAIARWSDGSQSPVPVVWRASQSTGVPGRFGVTVSATGYLASRAITVRAQDEAWLRTPDEFLVTATYDGTSGSTVASATLQVRPLIKEPMALVIRGAVSLREGDVTSYQAFVRYSDGSEDESVANWASDNTALLQTTAGASFRAGEYPQKPTQPQRARVRASQGFSYLNADAQPVSRTLEAELEVAVTWLEPTLRSMYFPGDFHFIDPSPAGTTVALIGEYSKLGRSFMLPVTGARLSSDNALLAFSGHTVTVVSTPRDARQSWALLTASTDPAVHGPALTISQRVTIDRAATVSKRLLAMPWGPTRLDTQFRAINSAGHLIDYEVSREADIYRDGYTSAAAPRRVRLLSGVTDFAQSQTVAAETQYVTAVSFGELLVARLDDLYAMTAAGAQATPLVIAAPGRVISVALVYRRSSDGQTASTLLYVRTEGGAVHRYALPANLDRPLESADVVYDKALPGSYSAMSAGAEHILFMSADGSVFAEGSNAMGQTGNPAVVQVAWQELFRSAAVEYDADRTARYSPFVANAIHAERDASMATTATNLRACGRIESVNYLMTDVSDTGEATANAATRIFSATGTARAMTNGAFVQADGSVMYRTASFSTSYFEGRDLFGNGGRNYLLANWLPPAREIVAGRRPLASWPDEQELQLVKMMPVVRTEDDRLIYLDGRPLVDAAGAGLVIP